MASRALDTFGFYQKRVLREERGQSGVSLLVDCLRYFHPKQIEFVKCLDVFSETTRKSKGPAEQGRLPMLQGK